jgi:hypothetical protein
MPPTLLKRCLAAVQSLSLSQFPKPAEFEKTIERTGYMQAAELPVAADGKLAFQCLRCACEAYWPEFDWSYVRQLEDAVARLLSGPKAAGSMLPASHALALLDAQSIWEKGMRRIERAATAIRDGDVSPAPPPGAAPGSPASLVSLFADPGAERTRVWETVASAREMNTRAAVAASLLASQHSQPAAAPLGSPAGAPKPGGKPQARYTRYTCTDHRDVWETLFPGFCQYYAIAGSCHHETTCRKKHEPLPKAQVDAHVLASGGLVSQGVALVSL